MPQIRDLDFKLRTFLRAYRWRKVREPLPCAPRRPPAACRVALVSSAGLVMPGEPPFEPGVRGGDYSHRVIPADADVGRLEEHHRSSSFDHSGIEADRNLALPLDRLHELAAAGEIGEVSPRHISLMGSITAPGRLMKTTVPKVLDLLAEDEVDLALLVPV